MGAPGSEMSFFAELEREKGLALLNLTTELCRCLSQTPASPK